MDEGRARPREWGSIEAKPRQLYDCEKKSDDGGNLNLNENCEKLFSINVRDSLKVYKGADIKNKSRKRLWAIKHRMAAEGGEKKHKFNWKMRIFAKNESSGDQITWRNLISGSRKSNISTHGKQRSPLFADITNTLRPDNLLTNTHTFAAS